ncbi:hypothetical protein [Curtobacterium sp. MCBD17_003]|uniref:hypothetical protein n=1 Tax=Curtobacterium sp. MCBD17_003 TaxID=2175667 RepID=UPI0011B3B95D|nr:hypothetical protein [Curtobacterium sp. MCBD17_003]WIE53439.1 hypothetical protein DEI88_009725 [Curtobacterium sp. MCBD17_003]
MGEDERLSPDESGDVNNDLPLVVADDEYVERIVSKTNVSGKGGLRWQALKPRPGEMGVSVIRAVIGKNVVKRTAKAVIRDYVGLAEGLVGQLRAVGVDVVDERRVGEYHGHAEIRFQTYPEVLQPYEPVPATEGNLEQIHYYKSHLRLFRLLVDPDPSSESWDGPALAGGTLGE